MIFESFVVPPSWWQPLAYSTENDNNSHKAIMKEIDWEQRRYEIARDVFYSYLQKYDKSKGKEWMAQCADALIEVFKKTSK